ncbi:MAG TPA: dipeptidase [Parvibaculum sp.]
MKKIIGAGIALLALTSAAYASDDDALTAKAREIQSHVITIDTHTDIPTFFATPKYDPDKDNPPPVLVDIPKMKKGGLDAVFFIAFVEQTKRDEAGYAEAASEALAKFAAVHRMTDEQYPSEIGLALTSADIRRIHASGRRVALIGIENGYSIGREPALLDIYYKLGARYFGLVHNGHNDIADSAQPQDDLGDRPNDKGGEHGGLSPYGRKIIARCNDLGIMVDVSHSAKSTTLAAIKASRAPIIASHSGVYALNPHPRNMSDEEMKLLAKKGGVIQIIAFDEYLKPMPKEKKAARGALAKSLGLTSLDAFFDASPEVKAKFQASIADIDKKWPRANVHDLVDHIDYAVKLIGIDHVGIASDFQGGGGIEGWSNAGETLNVTKELVRRGYSEADIAKLWGGNLMRVMDKVASLRRK